MMESLTSSPVDQVINLMARQRLELAKAFDFVQGTRVLTVFSAYLIITIIDNKRHIFSFIEAYTQVLSGPTNVEKAEPFSLYHIYQQRLCLNDIKKLLSSSLLNVDC